MRSTVTTLVILVISSTASAEETARDGMVFSVPENPPAGSLIDSHILFLNKCPSGCVVTPGTSSSLTNKSDLVTQTKTLAAFNGGASAWTSVLTCVQGVMAPFNITVTDVDPGPTVDHFEVMVAGSASDIGLSSSYLGIADYQCGSPGQCSGTYYPNALVFDFANAWQGNVNGICGTAAQEIAHAWTLDHTTLANDPMTYKNYTTPLKFQDGAPCGSDCQYSCPGGTGVCNSFGVTCVGSNTTGTHLCMGTGIATQDEVKTITALFGPAGAKAPMVAITAPADGSAVQTGTTFPIDVTCTTSDGIEEIDLSIDGVPTATLTTSPANFTGPNTLVAGNHHITALCGTKLQATASATADIVVGTLCATDADCPTNDICYEKACITGPNATGGLGATCTGNSSCASGSCGADGNEMLCVVPCDLTDDECPNGFGCLDAGNGMGVCWLGASKSGGGCCETGGDTRGSIVLGLGFAALFITRRKRAIPTRNRA